MIKSQPDYAVDMIVEMPRTMFQEKDYLNQRYFYKRAYFLAHVAAAIRKAQNAWNMDFRYLNDNPLLPVLAVSPGQSTDGVAKRFNPATLAGKIESLVTFRIQLVPVAPEGLFPLSKLVASKNGVRPIDGTSKTKPTPFYNSTLKGDTLMLVYLNFLRQTEKRCASFRDACLLGRVWLQQRGFGSSISHGGFGNFEWTVLTALLLQTGGSKGGVALLSSFASVQIFKVVVQTLAKMDLHRGPFLLGRAKVSMDSVREPGPVIYDVERQLNIAHKMTNSSALLLCQHAQRTHELFADSRSNWFEPTFIANAAPSLYSSDLILLIHTSDEKVLETDHRGRTMVFGEQLYQDVKEALGDRAKSISVGLPAEADWSVSDLPSPSAKKIRLGVEFDPWNMTRMVDRGPAMEDGEEAERARFRAFWGDAATLRKFQNGEIVETLIWTQTSAFALCEEILRYILARRHLLRQDQLEFVGGSFGTLIPFDPPKKSPFAAAKQAFETLEKDIRGLDDLPLHIRLVTATSPELRSASVQLPILEPLKAPTRPMDAVIEFEGTGKWPDNLAAIQRVKIAFLFKVASSLISSKSGISARVGLEGAQDDGQNLAFLDISYDSGPSFRLRIRSEQEEQLLEGQMRNKMLEQNVRAHAAQLLSTAKHIGTHLPSQNRTISTFCTRFPALSAAIRLTKQWFAVHKLTRHFFEEFIELVVLNSFLRPQPWAIPSSGPTGLLRTLLYLSKWDWRSEPLIVDHSWELTVEDMATIHTRLQAWRKLDPNMNHTVLFVATTHNTSGTIYSAIGNEPKPSKVAASRMTALARAATQLVKRDGLLFKPTDIFTSSLEEFDFLIHLSPKVIKATLESNGRGEPSVFRNLDPRTGRPLPPVLRHPAQAFVDNLDATYGGRPVMFFQGGDEDKVIGAVWNPQVHRRSFRVILPCSFKPVQDETETDDEADDVVVEVDHEGIVAEIARIGGDLIEKIKVNQH
jgi:U3 small nucleolar RNA-associated protein 22